MTRKLKCVIVDDDPDSHYCIKEYLKDSSLAEITQSFYKPSEMVENIDALDMDVVFLDIMFPNDKMQGFDIATLLKDQNKIIIFISGKGELIIEACKYVGALDVIPKPNTKERIISALTKAWKVLSPSEQEHKEHELFYVAGRKEKVSLALSDFLFVRTLISDPRNKEVVTKNGKVVLMNYTMEKLLLLSAKLARINKSELISYDIVESVFYDTIYLKKDIPSEIPKILTLTRNHRKTFGVNFI